MTISYNNNVPDGPNNPSVDQPKMKLNTQAIDAIIKVDHSGFNSVGAEPGGYHKIIHQIQQGTWDPVTRTGDPAATVGFNEVFMLLDTPDAAGAVEDTQLFSKTGNGFISQLTGFNNASEGYCWSGGLLFQWGGVSATGNIHKTGTILFKDAINRPNCPPFPRNCYVVIPALTVSSSLITPDQACVSIVSISKTQFVYVLNSDSAAAYTGFYWFAVGI